MTSLAAPGARPGGPHAQLVDAWRADGADADAVASLDRYEQVGEALAAMDPAAAQAAGAALVRASRVVPNGRDPARLEAAAAAPREEHAPGRPPGDVPVIYVDGGMTAGI
ncbi:hypothetical protein [Nonomuraea jabiensis]|uniref:hypothetical protein n=1 Tax=Nonomuraea jabiensis TaxID=882448 RepID=UPI00369B5CA9